MTPLIVIPPRSNRTPKSTPAEQQRGEDAFYETHGYDLPIHIRRMWRRLRSVLRSAKHRARASRQRLKTVAPR